MPVQAHTTIAPLLMLTRRSLVYAIYSTDRLNTVFGRTGIVARVPEAIFAVLLYVTYLDINEIGDVEYNSFS